jgi:signal transduction histidine kinase
MASYFSGKWTNPHLEYAFTVAPPFYRTPLFLGLAALVFVLVIALTIYYKGRKNMLNALALEDLKAKEIIRLRKEIGRDFHDELGNQLARIVNYISQIKLHRGESTEILTQIEESAKNLIGGTRDFIWALDHENDSLSSLFVHLKDFGDRLFSEKDIEFRAFHAINRDAKLPMGHTRQINLIVKESMTNCFRHAHATRVDLDFRELLFGLKISVKDNGVGIGADKKYSNGGLSNIKHRAERINSRFEIHTNGRGTEINLYVKT